MRTWNSLKQMTMVQFRSLYRYYGALIFNLALPLAFLLLFGALFGNSDVAPHLKVGLIDQDQGPIARQLQDGMAGMFDVVPGSETALQKGDVQALLIIPPGFSQQAAAGQAPAGVTIEYDPSSQPSSMTLSGLQSLIGGMNMTLAQVKPMLYAKVEQLPATQHQSIMDYMMPGELAFMLLNANIVTVMINLVSARRSGNLRHMLSTPLTVGVWFGSRLAANVLMGLVQCAVIIGCGMAFFHAHLPTNLVGTLAILVVSVLATAGIGLSVGSLMKTLEAAMPVGSILSMGLAFLGNGMMPLDNAPDLMQKIAHLLPGIYVTHALKLVMMQGQGLASAAGDLAVLAGWAVVMLAFGAWQLRRQTVAA